MAKYIFCLIILTFYSFTYAVENKNKPDQTSCLYAVEHMLQLASQAVYNPKTRPARAKKRKALLDKWELQLKNNVPPCDVYKEISQASTTF